MTIQKERAFDEVAEQRFKSETALDDELIRVKDEEINRIKEDRE